MRFRTTRQADQDIIDLYVHGAREFGVEQAERYHRGLIDTFELLCENPRLARERMEFVPAVRIHPYEAHLVIYTVEDNGLLIVRVLHGRSQWERYL
jgi:toxin ParE1/3/4